MIKCKYLEVSVRITDIISIPITDINLRDFRDQSFSHSVQSVYKCLSVSPRALFHKLHQCSLYMYINISQSMNEFDSSAHQLICLNRSVQGSSCCNVFIEDQTSARCSTLVLCPSISSLSQMQYVSPLSIYNSLSQMQYVSPLSIYKFLELDAVCQFSVHL